MKKYDRADLHSQLIYAGYARIKRMDISTTVREQKKDKKTAG